MISRPVYATREDVKGALDVRFTARMDAQVDRALEAASGAVEGLLHRVFYPWAGTRYFDWPGESPSRPWRLWLNQHELASVETLTAGGVVIPPSDYFLEPNGSGPPYNRIEIDLDSPSAFSSGDTHQRAVAATGVYCGCPVATAAAGALAEGLDSSETGVDVTDSSLMGVGDLLLVGAERMLVTGRAMADTGVNTGGALASSTAAVSVPLSTTVGAPEPGEVVLIGSERMLVVDRAGPVLTVKRAFDGSVLAAHDTAADIYAPRTLTVVRGAVGTVAAAHDSAAAIARHVVPGLVRQLCEAEAITALQQAGAGWARTAGSGDNERELSGRGLQVLREQTYTAFGRKARIRAV
jgi:hypothetical protein